MARQIVKAGYWFSASGHPAEQINSALFTHLYAGFAVVNRIPINDEEHKVITFPLHYERIFQDFPNIVRRRNPAVKALLSIGGEGPHISEAIAYAVSDRERRGRFIKESIKLARDFQYDGLDLCWLYPSKMEQSDQLRDLLFEWRPALDEEAKTENRPALLLTAAVFHHPTISAAVDNNAVNFQYPIRALSNNLDWINVLAIDFYTPSNSPMQTGPVHAWRYHDDQTKSGLEGIRRWTEDRVIPTNKVVLGLPFYGHQWTLRNNNEHGFLAPANPGNEKFLEFKTIQAQYIQGNRPGNRENGGENVAPYWYSQATWIGFEDANSICAKIRAATTELNLGGYFAWHVTADDDNSTLANAGN